MEEERVVGRALEPFGLTVAGALFGLIMLPKFN
jgi:hypothetical protein